MPKQNRNSNLNNRVIKFRVFCEKHNQWEFYTLGDLICGSTTPENGEGGIFKSKTWQQFTGLLDKNENEIYEGDILKTDSGVNQHVVYREDMAMFACRFETGATTNIQKEWEVIGNIYDNSLTTQSIDVLQ